MNKYYYFFYYRIIETNYEVNININPQYERLNPEQEAFYKAHPSASVDEIRKCKLNPIPEPPSIEEVRTTSLKELSEYSLMTMGKFCSTYQFANAQSSIIESGKGNEGIYDTDTANYYITVYGNVGKLCRTYYYEAKEKINGETDRNKIYDIVTEYKQKYDDISIVDVEN